MFYKGGGGDIWSILSPKVHLISFILGGKNGVLGIWEVGATVRTPQGSKRSRLWQPGSDLSSARKSVIKCYGNEKREWALWSTDSVRTYLFIIVVHGHQRAALSSRKLYLCHKPDRLIFWIYRNFFFFQRVEIKTPGILSSIGTQTGPWSDTFSCMSILSIECSPIMDWLSRQLILTQPIFSPSPMFYTGGYTSHSF